MKNRAIEEKRKTAIAELFENPFYKKHLDNEKLLD